MSTIPDTEHQISARLAQQAGGIRERGEVLAQHLRLIAIGLELQPLGFVWLGAQAVEKGG